MIRPQPVVSTLSQQLNLFVCHPGNSRTPLFNLLGPIPSKKSDSRDQPVVILVDDRRTSNSRLDPAPNSEVGKTQFRRGGASELRLGLSTRARSQVRSKNTRF